MKKIVLFLFLAALVLGFGCTRTPKEESVKNPPEKSSRTEKQEKPSPSNETNKNKYPAEVANWIEVLKPINAGSFIESSGKTYILVSWGLKNTGGYKVEKTALKDEGDKVTITVRFTEPPKDATVTQAITYPYLVETVNHPVQQVDFVNAKNGDYIPVIRGLPEAIPFIAESDNIKVMEFKKSGGLNITGLARVFEANIAYEIQDPNKKALKSGNTTAKGGAPDWGYFSFTETLPAGAKYVELYDVSPKDGHKQDVVTLEIK